MKGRLELSEAEVRAINLRAEKIEWPVPPEWAEKWRLSMKKHRPELYAAYERAGVVQSLSGIAAEEAQKLHYQLLLSGMNPWEALAQAERERLLLYDPLEALSPSEDPKVDWGERPETTS